MVAARILAAELKSSAPWRTGQLRICLRHQHNPPTGTQASKTAFSAVLTLPAFPAFLYLFPIWADANPIRPVRLPAALICCRRLARWLGCCVSCAA